MRVFVYIIVFFSFFDLFTQLPIMTPLAISVGATPFLTGLVVGMYSFSNTIGNVASGFLTDKRGPFLILITGLLLSGVSLFIYYFADNAWLLLLIRFVHGLTAGLIVPAAFTYLANSVETAKKGKGAALSGAFVGLAAVIGPAFSGIVSSRTNEVTVLTVTAFCMIALGILAFIFLRSQASPVSDAKQDTGKMSVRVFFQDSKIIKAFSGAFFLMFSQGVLAYMLPLKVADLGQDTQTSGLLLSTFGIVAILIFVLPTNRLFDVIKPIKTLTFGMGAMGVSLILISLSQSISILYIYMGLYGVGFSFLFPSLNSLLIEATQKKQRGRAYGYFYAFFSIGVVVGSSLTGLLQLTANQGFIFTGILLMIAAMFLFLKKDKSKPILSE
ncbi:MFS transporter [Lederbergia lenta]|uniref:Major facilitator transporter n=1 Tax=Lederbergia lenta TaxID=1467 RepID=A0A2X4YT68_LEDLE|nr:MFS transporter [Lederbergia lenta]MCM3112684.1 MFS transporter [Lederbergia lenta]MEC2323723.1 MFS transporter [Lederbergia lenta]SQI51564.1 major facilitator transporter [Lederbergia lenta]